MHFFAVLVVVLSFFVSHNLFMNVFNPIINKTYLAVIVYLLLFLSGQTFWLLFKENLPKFLNYPLYISAFTFSFMSMYYFSMFFIRFFYFQNNIAKTDLLVLFFAISLSLFGFFNRYFIRTTKYSIQTDKDVKLKIAFMSDIHIGDSGINPTIFKSVVKKINKQNVDLILLGGDIVEQDYKAFVDGDYDKFFKEFKTKYGVFAVLGNHEYYGGHPYQITKTLQEDGNIKVLNDESIELDNFVLIGREDPTKKYFSTSRKKIEEISNINQEKYNIVIDHNPTNFKEALNNNLDLQLSGHTHNGQFFPFNIVIKFFYEKPYGLLKKGNFKLITSSGLSTWRIPIKLFSKPEIVIIEINKDK